MKPLSLAPDTVHEDVVNVLPLVTNRTVGKSRLTRQVGETVYWNEARANSESCYSFNCSTNQSKVVGEARLYCFIRYIKDDVFYEV